MPSAVLTPLQGQVDGLVDGFVSQATDWKSLAALTVGGMAYRAGRLGSQVVGRGLLMGAGLAAEISAFELTNRSLHSENPNLWRWTGNGGLKQGLLSSLITFGTLKMGGWLTQSQNLILQHGVQDLSMVTGHQLVFRAGMGERPEGNFAEQILHAEATNWQLKAGTALGHGLTGGRLLALERGMDLVNKSKMPLLPPLQKGGWGDLALATVHGEKGEIIPAIFARETLREDIIWRATRSSHDEGSSRQPSEAKSLTQNPGLRSFLPNFETVRAAIGHTDRALLYVIFTFFSGTWFEQISRQTGKDLTLFEVAYCLFLSAAYSRPYLLPYLGKHNPEILPEDKEAPGGWSKTLKMEDDS